MMMRLGDILGRIFFILSQKSIIGSSEFIHGAHGGHGSSEIKRNLNGIYTDGFYSLKARNLWGKSLIKIWPVARNDLFTQPP